MRLAIFQCSCPVGEDGVAASMAMLKDFIRQAANSSADLVLVPELFLGGYCGGDLFKSFQQNTSDSAAFKHIGEWCAQSSVACLVGFVESSNGGSLYNSAAFFDKDGSLGSVYRKCHLWSTYEKSRFVAGNKLDFVFDFCGLKIGILICYDVEFPESVRLLKLAGAQLILVPTALTNVFNANITIPSRSFENHVFIAYANFVGLSGQTAFCGRSVVCAPDGSELWRGSPTDECSGIVEIDVERPQYKAHEERNPYLIDRRIDLYSSLTLPKSKP